MIRFVFINKEQQVIADAHCFAWFDTITDLFLSFSESQVWESWDEFKKDWDEDNSKPKDKIERFRGLFVHKYFKIEIDNKKNIMQECHERGISLMEWREEQHGSPNEDTHKTAQSIINKNK